MRTLAIVLAALLAAPMAGHAQTPAAFKQCVACHKVEAGKNGVGPSLFNVAGQPAGSVAGFKYSDTLKNSGKTWDDANLAAYLADPKGFIPGNKMAYAGLKKPEDVATVVEYLKTLK